MIHVNKPPQSRSQVLYEDDALPLHQMTGSFPLLYQEGAEIATRRHLRDISDYLSDIRWFCLFITVLLLAIVGVLIGKVVV